MSLSAEDAAELAALKAARTKLISGASLTEVNKGGRILKFAPADLGRLDARIAELEALRDEKRKRGALIFRL